LRSGGALCVFAALGAGCSRSTDQSTIDDLAVIDATETALRINRGEMTAAQSIDAAIERAARIDPLINAIVNETYDAARERAKGGETDEPAGPWWGVPSFIKDLIDVAGVPSEYGARAFKGFIPPRQYPFVDDYFKTGMISLGKTSTPEFGLTGTTEPLSYGATRNPWNLDHSTGGSSGGAAALVASGVVPVAHASDGGGSIRIPASCCGVVGLKVSRGRFRASRDESKIPVTISVDGVESRTVRDTAAFVAMMERPADVSGLPAVGVVAAPGKKRLKIAFYTDTPGGMPVAPDIIEATHKAAFQCAELGHEVTEITSPYGAEGAEDFLLYWASHAAAAVGAWETAMGRRASYNDFEPFTFGLIAHYERNKGQMERAIVRMLSYENDYAARFGDNDLFLSPVVTASVPAIGYLATDISFDIAIERLLGYASYTGVQNLSGAPAISLPLGQSEKGLPTGAHFAAPNGHERVLLALAYELEEAFAWRERRPGVYA